MSGKASEAKTFQDEGLVNNSLTFCELELICNFRYGIQNTIAHGLEIFLIGGMNLRFLGYQMKI
jgi:hypothetical protein